MTQQSPPRDGTDVAKRPKGILKNSASYQGEPQLSPVAPAEPLELSQVPTQDEGGLSEKELTLQNTLQNAGHRRSSSAATRGGPMSRRRSSNSRSSEELDPNNPRLKWDEANLYLAEQEKSSTMKINEPKTPYAKQYDPTEDEEVDADIPVLDAEDLMVDELDKSNMMKKSRESDIPGLDIGEPEEVVPTSEGEAMQRSDSSRDKQVVVDTAGEDGGSHGEEVGLSREEKEKHRAFEARRKRHYEMKDVKDLLAHPDTIDDDMDEDDDAPPPALPHMPKGMTNGTS